MAINLGVNIDNAPIEFTPGITQTSPYEITVSKANGSGDVSLIEVTSSFTGSSGAIESFTWTCSASGASSCASSGAVVNNSNSFSAVVNLSGDGNDATITITSITYASDIFSDLNFEVDITDSGELGNGNNNNDSTSSNDTDDVDVTRVSVTDISIAVADTVPTSTYTPGTNASYTIVVSNVGPSDADNVTIADGTPPAGLNITSWDCTADTNSSCSAASGGTNVALSVDLADDEQATIVVTGNYSSSATTSPLTYAVSATVTDSQATDPDGSVSNNADSNTINPVSNLDVALTTPAGTYTPGATENYQVVVTNNGPSDVSGVNVVDNTISANTIGEFESISWTCTASSGSSCSSGSGSLNTTANLLDNGTATYIISVEYDSAATADPLNYAVTATNPASHGSSSDSDDKDLTRLLESNLTVTLDDGDLTYVPGLGGTFTATITNTGPSDVTGVTVVDSDLSEISDISWVCSVTDNNSSCDDNGPVTLPVDTSVDLAADDAAVFIIDVNYLSSAITNPLVYQITANLPAGVNGDSSVTGTDNDDALDRQVNISLLKESKDGSFVPDEPFTYTITITNAGPSDLGAPEDGATPAENLLILSDVLDETLREHPTECNNIGSPCWKYCPSDLGVPGSNISQDNCPGFADIPSDFGGTVSVPIHLSAGSSSEVRVHARVTDESGLDDFGNGNNCDGATLPSREICNTAEAQLTTTNTTNIGSQNPLSSFVSNEIEVGTDLLVTKTDNLTSASPGTEITYEIVVRNDGFTDAEGITFEDILPVYPAATAGLEDGSISWTCETLDSNACCISQSTFCGPENPTSGSLGLGQNTLQTTIDLGGQTEVLYTVTGTISNQASGTLFNTATATLPTGIDETDELNNTAVDDDTVLGAESDVAVTKILQSAESNPDTDGVTDLSYLVTVTNNGPSFADDVRVEDILDPIKLDLSSASWRCDIEVGSTGTCEETATVNGQNIDTTVDLAVGSSATFALSVSTMAFEQGAVINVASVTASGFDPVTINNSAVAEYALSGTTRLRIDNDDALQFATPGLNTNYTIRVLNEGPDNVFGATVENIFPPQLTDVEWTCSAVSPIPGDLTFFQSSDQTIAGTDMLLSPDGSHIYIASPDIDGTTPFNGRIYVFERNTIQGADFGQITFVEFVEQGTAGIDGIASINEFQMSSDGAYLYAMSSEPDDATAAISIFNRDTNRLSPDFGKLTFKGAVVDEMPVNVVDILLSPDQDHLYVTGDGEINRYDRDPGTGLLTFDDKFVTAVAGHLVVSSDGSNLYVVDESGDQLDAYDRNIDDAVPEYGDLTLLNSVNEVAIDAVSDVVISADDRSIYLAATGTDSIVVIDRNITSGQITYNTSYDDTLLGFNSTGTVATTETLVGLRKLAISADGEHLFISNPNSSDPSDGSLYVLSRNSQGLLSKDQKIILGGMEGLSDVVITADGKQVLATATDGKTLLTFDRRQPDPTFSYVETEIDQVNDTADVAGTVDGLLGAGAVVVSRDGQNVYAAAIGGDAIAAFTRDKTKGSTAATRGEHLLFIDSYTEGTGGITGIADVNSLAISPNGSFLYAGSRDESTLAVFSRQADGTLSFVTSYAHTAGQRAGLLGVSDILVDENSQNLYVVGQFEASIAHYSISGSGELTLVSSIANGDIGVSGLGGARALALTADSEHVIVASGIDDSVVVFKRSLSDGSITFQQSLPGVGDQPMDLAASPDGEHVYVVSANDSRLTVLNRNNSTAQSGFGQLSINNSYVDDVNGFDRLQGLRAVVVSPNGEKVYVGAEFDAAVSVLDRDTNPNSASFGLLSVVEVQIDDVDGVDGLNQLYDLAVSRDSKNVYAVGFGDNALSAFVLGEGSSCSAQGSGNISDVVDIGSNGTLTYSVSAKIRSNATDTLVTEARIIKPENFTIDSPLDNCAAPSTYADDNCDQDTTTLVPVTDLSITKTNDRLSSIAGEPVEYTIRVSNAGPSDANSGDDERVMVRDILGSDFEPDSINWTCEALGSGALSYVDSVIDGVNGVDGLAGVSSVAYSPDLAGLGPHVLATSVTDNGLLIFAFDEMTGSLTQVTPLITADSGFSLRGARDVLVVDNDIYVASQVDDAVVAFKASDSNGLTIQSAGTFNNPPGGVGLNQAVSLTLSESANHLYVTGANDDAVVIFNRDVADGVLTYSNVVTGASQGLNGINSMAVSTDGYSAYTSGFNDNELGVYKRDLVSGDLTFVEAVDLPGVAFDAISDITISPDDQHVYVTNAGSNQIQVFVRETEVIPTATEYGSLTSVQTLTQGEGGIGGLLMPSSVVVSDLGRHVYVSSEQSDAVVWFSRNNETGALVYGGLISDLVASVDGLNGAIDLAVDEMGKYVFVAGSQDNGIAVLQRSADSFCPSSGIGDMVVDEGGFDLGIPVDLAVNGELIIKVNATVAPNASGTLVNEATVLSCEIPFTAPIENCAGSDPNAANNTASDTDVLDPTADLMITKTDGVSIYDALTGASQVTGDSQFLYVAAAQDNAVSIFKRAGNLGDGGFGALTFIGSLQNGANGVSGLLNASDIIMSEDGETIYVAGSGDNSVVVFDKSNNGQLTFVEKQTSGVFGVSGIEGVSALTLSADGDHLYATGPLTNSLAVFAVDQSGGIDDGKLTFIQKLQDSVDGVSGLANASSVVISADNMHAYVTSPSGNAVSVFLRNPNDASLSYGELSYLTTYSDGSNGVGGLLGANKVILDDNGEHVYVLSGVGQSLALFNRDAMTGELNFVEFKQNGTSGVEGLNLAAEMALSHDQLNLYVAGQGEHALVRFNRDISDGRLSFAEVINDGDVLSQPGTFVNGLTGASGLHLTADGQNAYVAANQDNSVAVFNRESMGTLPNLGAITFNEVLINGSGGVAPGSELTYVIVASNAGPSDAEKVRVVDIFPPQFEQISYQCFPINGAGCNTSIQSGNVDELVDLPQGASVEIRATGVVRTDAQGTISNTATIASSTDPALSISDPNLANNSATDDDTVLFVSTDLTVIKTNNSDESVPGAQVSYTITVSNDAALAGNDVPADVKGVAVTDVVPESISEVVWTCEAFPLPGLLDDGDGDPGVDNYLSFTDLDQHQDVVFHPNEELAYAIGELANESNLLVYQRNSRSGDLVPIQTIAASTVSVGGLAGAKALAISPSNNEIYVVSNIDDSITTWTIDAVTGTLSYAGKLTDGLAGVNGLGGANDVLVSPDGLHVYVAGKSDNAIAIFDRNIGSGALSFNSFLTGVEGLVGVQSMALSGDYLVVVADANQSIATFTRTIQNGLLSSADVIQDFELQGSVLEQPRDLVVVNDLVLVASYESDAVSSFSINPTDGMLSFESIIRQGDTGVNGLDGPESIIKSASGNQIYVASSVSEAVMLFTLKDNVLEPSDSIYDSNLITDLDGVNQVVLNQSGTNLYALSDELVLTAVQSGSACTDSGQGSLNDTADIVSMGYVEYTLTGTLLPTATGELINTATALMTGDSVESSPFDNTDTDVDIMVPTSDLSLTKDDALVQVVAGTELLYDLSVFSAGPSAINVVIEDVLPIFPDITAGFESGTNEWSCSTGRTLQVNGTYEDDGSNGLAAGDDVFESPDGQFVYVLSSQGTLTVFLKDTSGILTGVQTISEGDELAGGEVSGLLGATAATMDAEGQNIYLANPSNNQLIILSRNATTGVVDYVSTLTSGTAGIVGMLKPVSVVVAPDGTGVYVAAFDSDAITVFARDAATGALSFVERVKDGFGTIVPESNVIIEVTDLTISPDGQYLYSAADFSESVAVFSRSSDTQVLTFERVIRGGEVHGQVAVPVISGVQKLVMTNNGDFIYVLSTETSSLLRFRRDSVDGDLQYLSQYTNGDMGVGSMQAPSDVTITPDGGRLLITDAANDFISIYDRETDNGDLSLIDEFNVNLSESQVVAQPVAMTTDGTNIYVVLNQQNALLAMRITADADCQADSEITDTPFIPLHMAPGSSAQMQVSGLVHPSARGTISNVANVLINSGDADNDLANNTAVDNDTEIIVETEVAVTKTGPEQSVAGEPITYEITLTNTGPSDALGVNVTDTLATELFNATWTCEATGRSVCENSNGTGSIDESVNVTIDGEIRFTITAQVDPAFNGLLTNQVDTVVFEQGFNTDTDLSNNSDLVETEVTQVADLSVTKTNNSTSVVAGEMISYQIVFTNAGPSDAPAVVVDMMPTELQQVSWQCVAGSGSSCMPTGQGDINDTAYIAAGSELTYQVNANLSADATGQVVNEAMIDPVAPVTDPDMMNNIATDSDGITQEANIGVALSESIDPYDPAGPIDLTYVVEISNSGPSVANNVVFDLPPLLNGTIDAPNICSVDAAGVDCTVGQMAVGQTRVFFFDYRLNPSQIGLFTNSVVASLNTFDPDLNNNSDTTETNLITGIDVRVAQSSDSEVFEPGGAVTYQIILENIGSIDAGEVTIDEQLPVGLIDTNWQCEAFDGASCLNIDTNNLTGGADLPSGGRVMLTLTATVDPTLDELSGVSEINNTVEAVLVNETDYNLMNNTSTLSTPVVFFIFKDGFDGGAP
ncbi:beta-propeller fold lactonase family protein [Marinicella sp. S1101]|uniref:beta-propeller fold lactonase family protein n=1 Tax=Marinicella marina TaxID=2996016 RepID=UPI002260DFC6|nr:beta-propeller fold lactonase family protein [Marinicella marina]MCX7554063.1 beta-propeller fold lactonase family protein [Marinicella marina]MDJ1141244.1 beta-propeller fold lactonase family protein [Marinicella marina]